MSCPGPHLCDLISEIHMTHIDFLGWDYKFILMTNLGLNVSLSISVAIKLTPGINSRQVSNPIWDPARASKFHWGDEWRVKMICGNKWTDPLHPIMPICLNLELQTKQTSRSSSASILHSWLLLLLLLISSRWTQREKSGGIIPVRTS